jgi:hypothetical protein
MSGVRELAERNKNEIMEKFESLWKNMDIDTKNHL